MGHTISLFIMRAATIITAGLLLFVAFNARAQGYGGYGTSAPAGGEISNYGRVPLPEPVGPAYSPAAAANNSYNAAPVTGGYYPPQPGAYPPQVAPYQSYPPQLQMQGPVGHRPADILPVVFAFLCCLPLGYLFWNQGLKGLVMLLTYLLVTGRAPAASQA